PDGFQADSVRVELIRIHFYSNRWARAAPREDLSNAFDLRQLLRQDGISGVINLRWRNIFGRKRKQQDRRVSRIGLAIIWLAGQISGKLAARRVDGRLHITGGDIDVAIQVELQRDSRGAQAARGSHLRHAGDAPELALQRSSYGRRHSLWT